MKRSIMEKQNQSLLKRYILSKGGRFMKWLWALIIFALMAGSVAKISYGADGERFVFYELTVTDKSTGLIWTRKGNMACEISWHQANNFVKQLNKKKYAGYNNWRLPSDKELGVLFNYAMSVGVRDDFDVFFNRMGFNNVQRIPYWSSTTYPGINNFAYYAVMYNGNIVPGPKDSSHCVWPVRGGKQGYIETL